MLPLCEGVFLGGFDCSAQRLEDGRRLDMIASTRHDVLARADYARLRSVGMTTCRDGVSWVRSERHPGVLDFSVARRMARAARETHVRVMWDLMRFGWPDDVDLFSSAFPARFAHYAARVATMLRDEGDEAPILTPIDAMSRLAWAGGEVRAMNPFESARGVELKAQLVRATIEAIEAIRSVAPRARFVQPEPLCRVVPAALQPKTWRRVEADNLLQYQAWDMLSGRIWPSLGGHPSYLDVVGVSVHPGDQCMLDGTVIRRHDERYTPLADLLALVYARYGRPMVVSATGSEGDDRAPWLRYVAGECERAMNRGCELHAITLYPVVDRPGSADGLFACPDDLGQRAVHEPLLEEVRRQNGRLIRARTRMLEARRDAGTYAVSA
ncbi:MAG TPA: hypothetical protein VGH28_08240 [Polyangiaceae bacterium]|jgi:hypothetical protein